jgi:hypothetical protein
VSAISNLATYLASLQKPIQKLGWNWSSATTIAGRPSSMWKLGPQAGASPAAASVPDNSTAGGILHSNGGLGQLWMPRMSVVSSGQGMFMLADRLSQIGGVAANLNTNQAFATAALTRYTNGYGVHIGLEISTQIGTTATTVALTYTDAESAGSKTSPLIDIGGTNNREAGRFFRVPLAAQDSSSEGHSGATAVDHIQFTATTGTAGDVAIILYRPLLMLPLLAFEDPSIYDSILSHGSNCPEIFDNACLMGVVFPTTTASGIIIPTLTTIET